MVESEPFNHHQEEQKNEEKNAEIISIDPFLPKAQQDNKVSPALRNIAQVISHGGEEDLMKEIELRKVIAEKEQKRRKEVLGALAQLSKKDN